MLKTGHAVILGAGGEGKGATDSGGAELWGLQLASSLWLLSSFAKESCSINKHIDSKKNHINTTIKGISYM